MIVTEFYPKMVESGVKILADMNIDNLQKQIFFLTTQNEQLKSEIAIFDKKNVWYGNINLLGDAKTGENIMRLENCELADELIETEFLTK